MPAPVRRACHDDPVVHHRRVGFAQRHGERAAIALDLAHVSPRIAAVALQRIHTVLGPLVLAEIALATVRDEQPVDSMEEEGQPDQ